MPVRAPAPDLPPGRRAALIIATSAYEDGSLAALRSPAQDAVGLASVLADPDVGGFEVTSVVDRTVHEVRVAVEDFLADRAPGELLLVYLSCHGVLDRRGRLYFAAADTRKSRLASTGIEPGWLLDLLDECRARRQILILDCCFSGAFAEGAKGTEDLDLERRLAGPGRGRAVLTASRAGEYSFEGEPLPDADSPAASLFTAGLIDGLRTGAADTDHDGLISVEDAHEHACSYVREHGADQTPQRWLYGAEGRIWLARNPTGVPLVPAPVPEALRAALDSPHPQIRIGAVTTLAEWLTAGTPGQALTARGELQRVADTDNPHVAGAAREHLRDPVPAAVPTAVPVKAHEPPPPAPPPAPAPVSVSAPAPAPEPEPEPPASAEPPAPGPRLVQVLKGRRSWIAVGVYAAAFSPDGRLLATASGGGTIPLWDPATGLLRHSFAGPVEALAFSPDGRLLATASGGGTVRLWDPATGGLRHSLAGPVTMVAFSPDGRLLAAAKAGRDQVRLWSPGTGRLLRTLTAGNSFLVALAFSPDGRLLATAGGDNQVRLWDPATGEHLTTVDSAMGSRGHRDNSVAFSPDGRLLATTGAGDTVRLRDAASGRLLHTLTGHTAYVGWLTFSPDGRFLATTSANHGTVRLWDPATGQLLRVLTAPVGSVAFSPDGGLLATASEKEGTVRLWDPASGRLLHTLDDNARWIGAVAFSPDGRLLAAIGQGGKTRLWLLEPTD